MTESDAFLVALTPLLLVVGWVDARSGRIPNAANAAIAVLGTAGAWRQAPELLPERLVDAVIIGALLLLLRHLYARLRGHAGLGLGDVKFLAAAAIWTGLGAMPILILAASGTALTAIALMRLSGQDIGAQTRLRFGPYLAGALLLVLLSSRCGPLYAPDVFASFSTPASPRIDLRHLAPVQRHERRNADLLSRRPVRNGVEGVAPTTHAAARE